MRLKIISATILIFIFILTGPLLAISRVFLLISEQFPQIPIKPLHLLTNQPKHQRVSFGEGIVGDLFLPNYTSKRPAAVVAMGVRTNEKDLPILLAFCDSLARLGYVVLWPRLEALDQEKIKFEQPQTFVDSFHYLASRPEVNSERISFVGFSVGSSLAMVALEDPAIKTSVHSLVFFGGFYNIFDYLNSLATKSFIVNGQKVSWSPDQDGVNHAQGILEKEGLTLDQFKDEAIRRQINEEQLKQLLSLSPDQNLDNYQAPIFILHEKADSFVPYVESIKLKQTLEGKVPITFHLANLFEHVQPKKGLSLSLLGEFAGLFGFLYKVFLYL